MDQVTSIDIVFLSGSDGVCLVSSIFCAEEAMGYVFELSLSDAAYYCCGDNRYPGRNDGSRQGKIEMGGYGSFGIDGDWK